MKIEEVRLDEKAFGGIGRKRRVASRSAKFAGQRRRMVDGGLFLQQNVDATPLAQLNCRYGYLIWDQ